MRFRKTNSAVKSDNKRMSLSRGEFTYLLVKKGSAGGQVHPLRRVNRGNKKFSYRIVREFIRVELWQTEFQPGD